MRAEGPLSPGLDDPSWGQREVPAEPGQPRPHPSGSVPGTRREGSRGAEGCRGCAAPGPLQARLLCPRHLPPAEPASPRDDAEAACPPGRAETASLAALQLGTGLPPSWGLQGGEGPGATQVQAHLAKHTRARGTAHCEELKQKRGRRTAAKVLVAALGQTPQPRREPSPDREPVWPRLRGCSSSRSLFLRPSCSQPAPLLPEPAAPGALAGVIRNTVTAAAGRRPLDGQLVKPGRLRPPSHGPAPAASAPPHGQTEREACEQTRRRGRRAAQPGTLGIGTPRSPGRPGGGRRARQGPRGSGLPAMGLQKLRLPGGLGPSAASPALRRPGSRVQGPAPPPTATVTATALCASEKPTFTRDRFVTRKNAPAPRKATVSRRSGPPASSACALGLPPPASPAEIRPPSPQRSCKPWSPGSAGQLRTRRLRGVTPSQPGAAPPTTAQRPRPPVRVTPRTQGSGTAFPGARGLLLTGQTLHSTLSSARMSPDPASPRRSPQAQGGELWPGSVPCRTWPRCAHTLPGGVADPAAPASAAPARSAALRFAQRHGMDRRLAVWALSPPRSPAAPLPKGRPPPLLSPSPFPGPSPPHTLRQLRAQRGASSWSPLHPSRMRGQHGRRTPVPSPEPSTEPELGTIR
ncbi:PREDICTED: proline-rich protein 36-like [Chinchilla lanigera]|uniref:proline-rich protein 36-like n=1 Tax=Chinchilla lanigera TaxID=34839 RepID=UPI0006979E68|nr:PREDICTED: proline-rich protein 36-like [Chinchilla lanigera]